MPTSPEECALHGMVWIPQNLWTEVNDIFGGIGQLLVDRILRKEVLSLAQKQGKLCYTAVRAIDKITPK